MNKRVKEALEIADKVRNCNCFREYGSLKCPSCDDVSCPNHPQNESELPQDKSAKASEDDDSLKG